MASELQELSGKWLEASVQSKYSYGFRWLGRPVIQYPQDLVAMQEIIWQIQPDLIIETGIAHGGSLIFSASMLALNAACGGPADSYVLGIDIDIREHNRSAIEAHPLFDRITMLEGSSIEQRIVDQVVDAAQGKAKVMVCLDSNHTNDHVLAELEAYASLTTVGSYCVVFDTVIEDLSAECNADRPWGPGNNPKTAVEQFLLYNDNFVPDTLIDQRLLISVAPGGYLRRVS